MLIISRHKDEGIIIADNIKLTVISIRRDKVRIGINAPREISVYKSEVYETIQRGDFRSYIESSKYEDAYKVLLKGGYKPASNELSELKEGLRKMGKLDKSIEDKLNEYKSWR